MLPISWPGPVTIPHRGISVPKARQRCVADGKLVNIPAPSYSAMGGRIAEGHRGVGSPRCCIEEGA